MRSFDYDSLPSRVIFGQGALERLPDVAAELGAERVLVVTTASQREPAERTLERLGAQGVGLFADAAMHTPVDVTERAMQIVEAARADGIAAIGGGSAIGLSKAIALRTDLPQIVVPTTYAGSEMTPILGQTENGVKATQRTAKVLPEVVIYDVDLTVSLPPAVSVTSGFNAIAHAVEGLYAKNANALLSAAGVECVRDMTQALQKIVVDPADLEARSQALQAAWLGGWCLANGGAALHHRLCHILGGAFGLPHAETHTILLPHVLAFNAKSAPEAIERLCTALETDRPAQMLFDLSQSLGAPGSLRQIGLPREGIAKAVQAVLAGSGWNPAPLDEVGLELLLTHAWRGDRPHEGYATILG